MSMLADLPLELIELILSCTDPIAVAYFSQTCHLYYSLVYESDDQHLWRSLFLSDLELFDDPRKCQTPLGEPFVPVGAEFDWRGELQQRVRAETIIAKPGCCKDDDELTAVLTTLVSMVNNTPAASTAYALHEISRNLVWLIAQRSLSGFIEQLHVRRAALAPAARQRLAQLHTLFGLTVLDFAPARRAESRAYVYDMRNYTEATRWGPFTRDGRGEVNWEHLLAVQHVMAMNVVLPPEDGERHTTSLLPYCQSQLARELEAVDDWAGVGGTWSCMFCFIDHRVLTAYNETETRDTSLFEASHFLEVFRSFNVNLHVTCITPNSKHPSRPTITFEGVVHDVHTMVGTVSVADDNTVRWSFTSGEDDQMTWSSEGVQIGAIQSTFGVLGTWTTVFHDQEDPIGPFWLRKELDHSIEDES